MGISIRVTSPSRERSRLTTTTKNGKSQDKDQDLSAAIKSSTDDVVVLDEQLRVAATHEPLREETDNEEHGNAGVDADKEPAHIPQDHGDVHVLEEWVLGVAVSQPEGYGDDEADEVRNSDPFVSSADGEELGGHGPGDGEGIEPGNHLSRYNRRLWRMNLLLDILATPNIATQN